MSLKKTIIKRWAGWVGFAVLAHILVALSAGGALADCPSLSTSITHESSSYAELCGVGEIVIRVTHPDHVTDLTNLEVSEDLLASGLEYINNSTSFAVRYGSAPTTANISTIGSQIFWDFGDYILEAPPSNGNSQWLEIRFQVTRPDNLLEELVTADLNVQAEVYFQTTNETSGLSPCDDRRYSDPNEELILYEPLPTVNKAGRNTDAGQGNYTTTIYGHNYDDVIWRIRVTNGGDADLQDLHLDDVMDDVSMQVNYICPTENSAEAITNNNGVAPGSSPCQTVVGSSIDDFDVDNPFGNPSGDSPDLVDVPQDGTASIYLVGKIKENGSCDAGDPRANRVDDIQWGCQLDNSPPGETISQTSRGTSPGSATARLYTYYDRNLTVTRALTGVNTAQPVGSRGTMTITIANYTGGTVDNIVLTDVLPDDYVMDPTFEPTVTMDPRYGTYDGMIDNISWDNPDADPLHNTTPVFSLTSTGCSIGPCAAEENVVPGVGVQRDMLRHGDRLTITFRVVLINPDHYDKTADVDVQEETTADGLDPDRPQPPGYQLTNELTVDYDTFCGDQPHQTLDFTDNDIPVFPEDLDVDMDQLIYILTNDVNQVLPLTVNVTNNGGHDAENYFVYVAFGVTMDVVQTPSGCTSTSNPPPRQEWQEPDGIPGSPTAAAVYECTGGAIAPGQTRAFTFGVVKDEASAAADDLTFRADVVGQINLYDDTALTFPPINVPARSDGGLDIANNYSLDAIRARVIGFNLIKNLSEPCSENNPPIVDTYVDSLGVTREAERVEIGEECTFHIKTGGWFGFETPGFALIAVQDITLWDQLPDGQGYIWSTPDPDSTSSEDIFGVVLHPPPVAPNEVTAPDYLNWTFNQGAANQITRIDQWFEADLTARILNDPTDSTNNGPPNQHAAPSTNLLVSTFNAIFESEDTGEIRTYLLDENTVGYPVADVRQVRTTVTEPDITVVKEVCNETLYGTGPSCTNFVSEATDGDAFDRYIYRLTVTNNAASNGYDHSPAYNVTVSDTLDAADLAYVLPFNADGLNNDGDGSTDEAGVGSEGAISDNTINNGIPAQITFSHTHSTALARIDAGPANAVRLYYRVDFDDDAAPLQRFTNSAYATYDTLAGDYGGQTAPQRATGDAAGARFYTSAADTAEVRIIAVETLPKEIVALSNTPIAATGTQGVSVGEEIEYRLTTMLPVATLYDFVIRDDLPDGLSCAEAPVLDLDTDYPEIGFDPGGIVNPTCSGDAVEWHFGTQTIRNQPAAGNRHPFEISFIARVENTAQTNDNFVITNGGETPPAATIGQYRDEGNNLVTLTYGPVDVQVREPDVVMTKSFSVAGADAGDILTVTVTAENTGTATAYNLRILDDLTGRNMTYVPGSTGGANPPDTVDTTTFGANRPIFVWNPANGLAAGDTHTFTFDVRVTAVVQPEEILVNTIEADWTSLPGQTTALNSTGTIGADGSALGMRIGALPNAGDLLNDYEASIDGAQVVVPAPTMAKTDLDAAVVPAIGARKHFRIEVRLPEGRTTGLVVTDQLDTTGLSYVLENNAAFDITYTFQNIALINNQPPGESAFNAAPADGSSGTITWDIGVVDTATENDTITSAVNPMIHIDYYARLNNDLDTDYGDNLQNGAVATYNSGEDGVPQTINDSTAAVTVVEPNPEAQTVTKTWRNVTPGKAATDPPEGGDLLEFVVTMFNNGTSTAYDVNVKDALPLSLNLYSGVAPTATIGGSSPVGFRAAPANAPAGPLIWGRDNDDDSLDIPVGQTLVITYQAVVVAADDSISNSVALDWTSLDGDSNVERDGEGCPTVTAPNDYCTGASAAPGPTVDTNSIDKIIAADTFATAPESTAIDAIARVGDLITYRLDVNLSGGLTSNLTITDQLPVGMVFVQTVSINGDTAAPYSPPTSGAGSNFSYVSVAAANTPAAGQTDTLTWTFGDVSNDPFGDPTTDTLEIIYLARVQPDSGIAHAATTTMTNAVSMNYVLPGGPATQTSGAGLTVRQPILTVTKSGVAAGGDTLLAAGELIEYTVEIENSGGAPAYDPLLVDTLPLGLRNGATAITTLSMELDSGTNFIPPPDPDYDAATGLVTWNFDTGTANQYTIPAGDTLRIVYQVQADADLGAGLTLTNQAVVQQYASLDDDAIPTVADALGEAQIYGPTNTASVTFTTDTPDALVKENPPIPEAAIGELFAYRITVPETPQAVALHDVRIIDDLGDSDAVMHFVSVTDVSGPHPWTPVNTGTATQLVIEDPVNGIDIPAGEQIVLEITVTLDDNAANTDGLTFTNTASYTFNQIGNDPATQQDGGSDTTDPMTIVSADSLTLEKSGPDTMQVGTPDTFTLNLHNTSTGTVWNPTITDRLPDTADGGMCAVGPSNVIAQIFDPGNPAVTVSLDQGEDFAVAFTGDPTCEWTFTLLSPAGGVPTGYRMIVSYDVNLDADTANGATLTNVAGVTRWYSADPSPEGATPRIFTHTPVDGTPDTLDYEDAHTVTTLAPILAFEMSVVNVTTGQTPGSDASPGDTLEYTIVISNSGPVGLTDFSIVDDLDALNGTPLFAPGTLTLDPAALPFGADASATDANGGTNGTGLLSVGGLNIGAQDDANNTLTLVYRVALAPAITNGTTALNQAGLEMPGPDPVTLLSDDPNIGGDTDPTPTLIGSAPAFQVLKTATPMGSEPGILMAGELLRYTLTVKNVGDENAVQVSLRDFIPANTTYVAGSTTLNGTPVADPSAGVSPLESGLLLNAPEDPTPGAMRADTDWAADNVATVTFDVRVNPDVMDGLIIENQGFVNGSGAGSGPQPEQPSDDPNTPLADDPTRIVVGNMPLLYALKTVAIQNDLGTPDIADRGDTLRYTIVISNFGAIPATGVRFNDALPAGTTYVDNSLGLNGVQVGTDNGVWPLTAGLTVQSADNPGAGIISAGQAATVTFDVRIDDTVADGTVISNQGTVVSTELLPEPTDSDGVPDNGDQPTLIVVGAGQLLTVTKQVAVVGGGTALAGQQLEYTIRVTNVGSMPALQVLVTDDLNSPLGDQISYIDGSCTLDGVPVGAAYSGGVLTVDYGDMPTATVAVVRFRVQIDSALAIGTTITNTAVVTWNSSSQNDSASVSIDVGGTPGTAAINGNVWHDANLDRVCDQDDETLLADWTVAVYRNGQLVTSVLTDAAGAYAISGLNPNAGTAEFYELHFGAPGAGPNTAAMGWADSPFTNGPQLISAMTLTSGSNLQNINLPLWPNGAVYNSVVREGIAGARLALLNAATGEALPDGCFDDPAQQNQVTAANGFYKFDLNFSQAACPAGGAYLIDVTAPARGYGAAPSAIIPPTSLAGTTPFSIPTCPGSTNDAVPSTTEYCEVTPYSAIPPVSVPPGTAGTTYYLHLVLDNQTVPGQSQIFNNPIPIDPRMDGSVAITKTAAKINVTRGGMVPYTITVTNIFGVPLYGASIVDRMPPGFKYVAGSARIDGAAVEPRRNGLELSWDDLTLQYNQTYTLQLLLVVGSGVSEGEYVNRAVVFNPALGTNLSGEATATVRVVPDPDFDCTDVIGKVFDDRNLNGRQDDGEKGLQGVRVVTVRGLIATTDQYGRFHITCADVPDEDRGSNFILKLDTRSLPSGYRLTTENPRVMRATRGKMVRFNFGATIHRVVRIDIADGVFKPNATTLRMQWMPKLTQLIETLREGPSVLRLSYLADIEGEGLVQDRLDAVKKEIRQQWNRAGGGYLLTVETEVFWRRGKPFGGR